MSDGARFTVESYSAFHGKPLNPRRQLGMLIGADLYITYHPGRSRGNPPDNNDLQFIQVVYYQIGPRPGAGDNLVDTDRANPFYGEGAGLTSINGSQSISFSDFVCEGFDGNELPLNYFIGETFLAHDTQDKGHGGQGYRQHLRWVQMGLANAARAVTGTRKDHARSPGRQHRAWPCAG